MTQKLPHINGLREGNYFVDKNQRPKPTALSKACDLATFDNLSLLAKKVIEKSTNLQGNVNRVTDRLAQSNPQVVTLSTLQEMMKLYSPHESLEETEVAGLADIAASFYDLLASVRPELGLLEIKERRLVREQLLSDSAVMMHGYAALMKDFHKDLITTGTVAATDVWRRKLGRLRKQNVYSFGAWSGDLFVKINPLWQRVGVVKPGKSEDTLTVVNTGGARGECGRVLQQFFSVQENVTALEFLAPR
jgi:DNA-sulfur modification-associated